MQDHQPSLRIHYHRKEAQKQERIPQTGNAKPDHLTAPVVGERKVKEKDRVDAPQHQEMNQVHHVCTEREKDRRTFDKAVVAFWVPSFRCLPNEVGEAF